MSEYVYNEVQTVALNSPVLFNNSIPCSQGNIYHNGGDGVFILRGGNNSCVSTYQVTFNGNIAIPDGGTVTPIAVAIAINGEPRLTSRAIYTPTVVGAYGNVTSTAIVKVPRGCCFSLSVDAVSGSDDATVTPAPSINVVNANLTIARLS